MSAIRYISLRSGFALSVVLLLTLSLFSFPQIVAAQTAEATAETSFTVVATGFDNPRGLAFSPSGRLFVAEGGRGGTNTTVGKCTQAPPSVGPYTGGFTARISVIDNGQRHTVISGLPSSATNASLGGLVSGVADVAFIGNTLYALIAGGGCSHGIENSPNGVIRVNTAEHTWKRIADLSRFIKAHPVAHPEAEDFEPDGTWYTMRNVNGNLFVVEPNHGEVDEVTPDGFVTRLVDVSATFGHIVPTTFMATDAGLLVSNLNPFPIVSGSSGLYRVNRVGEITKVKSGLTAVVGIAARGTNTYVLQMSSSPGGPAPGTGKVIRIDSQGVFHTYVSGLTFPTGMTVGPEGALYISNFGFGFPSGSGQIVRVLTK